MRVAMKQVTAKPVMVKPGTLPEIPTAQPILTPQARATPPNLAPADTKIPNNRSAKMLSNL